MNVKARKTKNQVNLENQAINLLLKEELNKRIEVIEKELRFCTWRELETAASYFRIGEGKLRKLVSDNPNAEYLLWNGNRVQIKRERFEKFIDTLSAI